MLFLLSLFKAVVSTGQFREHNEAWSMAILVVTPFLIRGLYSPTISGFVQGSRVQRLSWQALFWHRIQLAHVSSGPRSRLWDGLNCSCFELTYYSKVIKLAGTCCLLLWQAALRCLNQSIAFILFPAWNLYEFPFSESVNKKRSGCSGSSAIITIQPTTDTFLLGVDLKCFLSVAFRDFAA